MANPWAGEVTLVIDSKAHVLKLTLGALAELEAQLKTSSLVDLVRRFEKNDVATADIFHLIVAGLRGGGWRGDAEELLSADIEGGVAKAGEVAAELLVRSFILPQRDDNDV